MQHYRLEIDGMGCAHCVHSVENALQALGASVIEVQIGTADVLFDGERNALKEAIEQAGFEVRAIVAL